MSVQFFLISRKTSDSTEYCNDDPYEFILWWLVKYKTNQDTEVFVVNSGKNNFPKALMTLRLELKSLKNQPPLNLKSSRQYLVDNYAKRVHDAV